MVRGIKFVGIPVTNQDVALKFYTESLGMKITTDQPFNEKQRWIELMIPGAETGVALFTPEGHEARIGQYQSVSFWCDDVYATAAALRAKGVVFTKEPTTETWGSVAIFNDPDGNKFVLASNGKRK
jgi:catechol 2,3-dioxygenase-like lactoylglutathione lyase family enzyme